MADLPGLWAMHRVHATGATRPVRHFLPLYSGAMDDRDRDDPELVRPEDFLPGNTMPADARRLGADRWSAPELAFAAALKPDKYSHRVVAWVMLVAILIPVVLGLWSVLRSL